MFIVLLCMLCDILCLFNFVCRSKSPTELMLLVICTMYSAQNKSSIFMSMSNSTFTTFHLRS